MCVWEGGGGLFEERERAREREREGGVGVVGLASQ